jgi:hypothetical protein
LSLSKCGCKKVECIEADSGAMDRLGGREMKSCWSKNAKFQVCGINKSRDLAYSMRTIVNNIVLYSGNLLRESILGALT